LPKIGLHWRENALVKWLAFVGGVSWQIDKLDPIPEGGKLEVLVGMARVFVEDKDAPWRGVFWPGFR